MPDFAGKKVTLERILSRSAHGRWKRLSLLRTQITDGNLAAILELARNLEEIEIDSDIISNAGMAAICSLQNLRSLLVQHGPKITDKGINEVARVSNLRELKLVDTRLSDEGVMAFCQKERLWSLNVSGTQITDQGMGLLRHLPSLRLLSLRATQVTWRGLTEIPDFTTLDIYADDSLISDQNIDEFVNRHSNLRRISLQRTSISDITVIGIAKLRHLEELRLTDTDVTDRGISALLGHPNLSVIYLKGTRVTRRMISQLRNSVKREIRIYSGFESGV